MQDNFNENQKDSFQNKIKIFDWFKSSFLRPTTDHGKKDVGVNPNIQLTLILIVLVVIATIYAYFLFNYEIKLTDTNVQLLQPRSNANASLMCDDKILITGGYSSFDSFSRLKSTEIFDINSKKMFSGPNLNLSHGENYNQFLLPNCEVVVIDEKGIEIYNPTKNIFELVEKNLNSINIKYQNEDYTNYTLLKDGNILITGGQDVFEISKNKIKRYPISKSHIFNTKTKKIKTIQNLPIPLMKHSSYINQKGDVYILGGETNSNGDLKRATGTYNSKIIKFDSKTERFSIVGDNTIKGSDNKNIKCALDIISKIYKLNDKEVIVIGGTAADFNDYDTIYKLNLESCESELLYMTNKQLPGEHSIFKNNNKIYLQDTHSFFGGVNIFDVNKKTMKHQFSIKFQMGSTVIPICKNQFILISDDDNKIYNVEIKNK